MQNQNTKFQKNLIVKVKNLVDKIIKINMCVCTIHKQQQRQQQTNCIKICFLSLMNKRCKDLKSKK